MGSKQFLKRASLAKKNSVVHRQESQKDVKKSGFGGRQGSDVEDIDGDNEFGDNDDLGGIVVGNSDRNVKKGGDTKVLSKGTSKFKNEG